MPAQTFLGTRIGCARCHNHPLEKYTQDDYYHFAGYFSRIRLDRKDPKVGPTNLLVSLQDAKQNKNPVGVTQPRTGKFLAPQTLERDGVKVQPEQDPRIALADWITGPKNDFFAGAMVNRIWAHYFNVGLVEPIDDLRESNPPSNPALWQALVKEFVAKKYDRKHLCGSFSARGYHQFNNEASQRERPSFLFALFVHDCNPKSCTTRSTRSQEFDSFDGYPLGLRAVRFPTHAFGSWRHSASGVSRRARSVQTT